jgi:hypothetical protein
MADFQKIREDLRKGRQESDQARLELNSSAYHIKLLEQELAALERQKGDNNPFYQKRKEELTAKINAAKTNHSEKTNKYEAIKGQLTEISGAFQLFTDPRQQLAEHFSNQLPFLLLPLKMETRFKTVDNKPQLWVRVYPDECMVDNFEPLLSGKEVNNAARFWAAYYSAGTSADPANPDPNVLKYQKAAWALLVTAAGDGRAAWITQQLKPDVTKSVFPLRGDKTVILAIVTETWDATLQNSIFSLFKDLWKANGNDTKAKQIKQLFNDNNAGQDADKIIGTYKPVNFDDQLPKDIKTREEADLKVAVVVFNDLASRSGKAHGWSQSSRVNILPERLALLRFKSDKPMEPIFGNPIPFPLHTSPDPAEDAEKQFEQNADKDLEFAEAIKWVADFDKAVSIGMGFRVDLAPDEVNGFKRLAVLGVRIGSDAQESKKQLEELFDHHYFSKKGFTLLPQGTPTNNTGSADAGFKWKDDPDRTFDQYFTRKDGFTETTDANLKKDGQWIAEWLGLDYATFKKVLYSGGSDQADARNMNIALWPATMGYAMESLMEGGFSGETMLHARSFFNSFVSGRGPVPAIRIGNQPYGIVTAAPWDRLRWWELRPPGTTAIANPNWSYTIFLNGLYQLLLKMDAEWKTMLGKVPYVAKASANPHQTLLDIVSQTPNSVEFHRRYMESLVEMKNKVSYLSSSFTFSDTSLSRAISLLKKLGYGTDILPQLAALFGLPWQVEIKHLIDDQPIAEDKWIRSYTADKKNYIAALMEQAGASLDAIRTAKGLTERPSAELYRLLKYALELGYHKSAVDAAEEKKAFTAKQLATMRTEQPVVHQVWKEEVSASRYAMLYDKVPEISATRTVSEYIRDSLFEAEIPFFSRYLATQIKALEHLKDATTARLERAFVEHLDCCNYRLDGWKTGLLTTGLSDMRKNYPGMATESRSTGIFLGAFGWLENVQPEKNKVLTPKEIPADLIEDYNKDGKKVFVTDSANEGYIHTPSLNQGVTAAVLRNGYISNEQTGANNVLAVNLTSERIRLALSIIEGIQGGQSLAALLGYHFERTLHDRQDLTAKKIDSYIYAIRKVFPLNADQLKDTKVANTGDPSVDPKTVPITAIEARNVVNGSKLANYVSTQTLPANKVYPFGLALPAAEATIADAITQTIKEIIDIADAVADLGMAESVHQVVMGNYDRAAGVLDSYSTGNYPQEPDVIVTPRSGPTLTHRVAIPFQYVPLNAAGGPRAQSEPSLNQWLTDILPAMDKIVCQCTYFRRSNGLKQDTALSLQQIGLEPIDLLYMLNTPDAQALDELDDRLLFRIHMTADVMIDKDITFNYITEPADADKLSVFQVMPLVKSLRALIIESPPLSTGDIALPNEISKKDLPAPELPAKRTEDLLKKLKDDLALATGAGGIIQELRALPPVATVTDLQLETIRIQADATMQRFSAFLIKLGSYGIQQTGIGAIYTQKQQWYTSLKGKVQDITLRWQDKLNAYNALEANPAPTELEMLDMERLISTTTTTGITAGDLLAKKNLFVAELGNFNNILATRYATVQDLIQAIRARNTAPFDPAPFDITEVLRQIPLFIYDLQARAKSLMDNLEKKVIPEVNAIMGGLSALSIADQATKIEAAAKIILGEQFKMFPRYALPSSLQTEIGNSWNDTAALLNHITTTGGRPYATEDWLHGMARVHEKMNHLENCLLLREAFDLDANDLGIHPVQLPYKTAEYHWMAMEFPTAKVKLEEGNILLYTAFTKNGAAAPNEVCGALVHEWTEVIPATEETTGLAFHYDRPSCEAPQAMLLVTPSQLNGNWQWNDLVDALVDTMESAKTRAVGPQEMGDTPFATLLPAVIAAESFFPYSIVLDNKLHYTTSV